MAGRAKNQRAGALGRTGSTGQDSERAWGTGETGAGARKGSKKKRSLPDGTGEGRDLEM